MCVCVKIANMFPRSESNAPPTISVTVTALTRPTSLGYRNNPTPSSPNTSNVPALDTPTITNILLNSLSSVEGVQSGVPTRTTPTLTPTTLRNIEQLFELPSAEVNPPEVHYYQAGFVPPPVQISTVNTYVVDNKGLGGGGVITFSQPTSVSPIPSSRPPSTTSSSSGSPSPSPMPGLNASGSTKRRTGGRRPIKDDKVSPEEEERRMLRRERNKEAAARCRKRRMDQTNRLQCETDVLEEKRSDLQQEIQLLQQQREELEFVLAAHKPSCKWRSNSRQGTPHSPTLSIKEEPMDTWDEAAAPKANCAPPSKPQRPTSLALGGHPNSRGSVSELGIAIETPSNGLRGLGLNFESMMEGGTGLTPVAVMAPISTGMTPLTTPIVTSAPSSNCGTQLRSSSSELSSPEAPHKLVSL